MRTLAYAPLLGLLGLLTSACGDSADGGLLTVAFSLSRGEDPVPCADVLEVMEVDARLRPAGGGMITGPTAADCASGVYEAAVPAGEYELELSARGLLSGDPSAVLFRGSEAVVAPGAADMVLAPQVAFLELSWTFGEQELAPCGTEVETVDVIVSAGAGQVGSFTGTFACTETPVRIEAPLDLREYTISVTANSAEGFPLFTHQADRLLDRGLNVYTANLMPLGGQVFVDWDFVVAAGEMPMRACDADRVQVSEATVTIESLEGGASVSETVACTDRPHAFSAARFTQGRDLRLTVEAEGRARFLAVEEFTMPAGDRVGDRLALHAVGTASVAVEVATASCAAGRIDGAQLTLTLEGEAEPFSELTVPADGTVTSLPDLWYGAYAVEAALLTEQGALCPRTEARTVDAGTVDWGTLTF